MVKLPAGAAYPIQSILPLDYMAMLDGGIGDSQTIKQYFRFFARHAEDDKNIEPEVHFNLFTKWMKRRTFIASKEICPWGPLKHMVEVAIVHYHTILSRILYNSNCTIPVDVYKNYTRYFTPSFFESILNYKILSRLFVDWSSEAWPYFEANNYFLDMMMNIEFKAPKDAGEDMPISKIMQAYPGFLIALPKGHLKFPDGPLSHIMVAHEVDENQSTKFITIILLSSENRAIRVINTRSNRTIKDCLNQRRANIDKSYLKLVFSILLYFMVKPEDHQQPSLKGKSSKNILLEEKPQAIEIWRAGRLGHKIRITPGYSHLNIMVTHKKRPHWRKGHWRYYKSCDRLTWVAPMLINKHLLLKAS